MDKYYKEQQAEAEKVINSLNEDAIKRLCIEAINELIYVDSVIARGGSIYWESCGDGLIPETDFKSEED